jgi:hypothetical protein
MNAILIHFIGFVLLDKLIPTWVGEVESGLSSIWYASFALIDVIALACTTSPWIKCVLAISCAWSVTLAIETILLQDLLQSHDYIAQWVIDGALIACAIGLSVVWLNDRTKRKEAAQ